MAGRKDTENDKALPEPGAALATELAELEATVARLAEQVEGERKRLREGKSRAQLDAMDREDADLRRAFEGAVAREPYTPEEQARLERARKEDTPRSTIVIRIVEEERRIRVLRRESQESAEGPAGVQTGVETTRDSREMSARMLTYRLVPIWIFLAVFGVTLIWEAGVRGNPITTGKLQAAALLSLFFALIIGAVVGIRFFNPQPPKA